MQKHINHIQIMQKLYFTYWLKVNILFLVLLETLTLIFHFVILSLLSHLMIMTKSQIKHKMKFVPLQKDKQILVIKKSKFSEQADVCWFYTCLKLVQECVNSYIQIKANINHFQFVISYHLSHIYWIGFLIYSLELYYLFSWFSISFQ